MLRKIIQISIITIILLMSMACLQAAPAVPTAMPTELATITSVPNLDTSYTNTPTPTWTPICDAACVDKLSSSHEQECLVVIAPEALHMRAYKSEHSEALDWLLPGTQLRSISRIDAEWVHVRNVASGIFGWVKSDWVQACNE